MRSLTHFLRHFSLKPVEMYRTNFNSSFGDQELLSSVDFPLRGELRNEKKHFLYCGRSRSVLVVFTNTKTFMEGERKYTRSTTKQDFPVKTPPGRYCIRCNSFGVWRWSRGFHIHCLTDKIVLTTSEAPVLSFVDFLRIYKIEVNSLAVWSKRVTRFKGKLSICWGKQELATTCSVYINAQDDHSKFTW